MKSVNLLVINAKDEDKQNIPNNSTYSNNQQNNSLNIKLKEFRPSFHMLLSIYIIITSSASYHITTLRDQLLQTILSQIPWANKLS